VSSTCEDALHPHVGGRAASQPAKRVEGSRPDLTLSGPVGPRRTSSAIGQSPTSLGSTTPSKKEPSGRRQTKSVSFGKSRAKPVTPEVAKPLQTGITAGTLLECTKGRWQARRFALEMGLPLTLSRTGSLLPGTYESASKDCGIKSRRKKLQNPDFVRAWATTVLLVRPGKKLRSHGGLDFARFHGEWYLLRRCRTLQGARSLAGLAITSPGRVFSYFGRSLCGLAQYTPDQLRWLWNSWRYCETVEPKRCGGKSVTLLQAWTSDTWARRRLARTMARTLEQAKPASKTGLSTECQEHRNLAPRDNARVATARNLTRIPVVSSTRLCLAARRRRDLVRL